MTFLELFFCCVFAAVFCSQKTFKHRIQASKTLQNGAKMETKMNQNCYKYRFFEKVKNGKKHCNVVQLLKVGLLKNLTFLDPKTFKKHEKKNNYHTCTQKSIFCKQNLKFVPKMAPRRRGKGGQRTTFFDVLLALGARMGQDGSKSPPRAPKNPKTLSKP